MANLVSDAKKSIRKWGGEFLVIVLGILAALAIDNWNSDRQDRQLERTYIESLLDDLRSDDQALLNTMANAEDYANSGLMVLDTVKNQKVDVSTEDFLRGLRRSGFLSFTTHSRHTINDLLSTGNLRIIRDEAVLKGVSDYYAEIDYSSQWQQNWRQYQVDLGLIIPEFVSLEVRLVPSDENRDRAPPWVDADLSVSTEQVDEVLSKLAASPQAIYAIENMVRTQGINYRYARDIRETLHDLIEVVEAYESKISP